MAWWACGEHLKPKRRYSPEDMQICTMKLLIYCGGHTWGKFWVHLRLYLSRGDGKNLFDFCINGFNRLLNRIKFKSNKSQCVHILSVYKRFRGAQLGVILLKDTVRFWQAHTHTKSGGGSGNCSLLIASWTGRAKVTVHLEAPDEAYEPSGRTSLQSSVISPAEDSIFSQSGTRVSKRQCKLFLLSETPSK